MYADIIISTPVLNSLVAAVLSRVETISPGAPNPDLNLRNICSWKPDGLPLPAASVTEIDLSPDIRIGPVRLADRTPMEALRVPGAGVLQQRVTWQEVPFTLVLGGAASTTDALNASNLGAPQQRVESARIGLKMFAEVRRAGPTPTLVITLNRTSIQAIPPILGGRILAQALDADLVQLPIPLDGIETQLGKVRIIGANLNCDPASGIVVVRLLFVPVVQFTPTEGDAAASLLFGVVAEANDLADRFFAPSYVAQLGADPIAIMVGERSMGTVLHAIMTTTMNIPDATTRIDGPRSDFAISPTSTRDRLAFSAAIDVLAKQACNSPLLPDALFTPKPDLTAGLDLRGTIAFDRGSLFVRARADAAVHVGSLYHCVNYHGWIPFLGGPITFLSTVLGLTIVFPLISAFYRPSQEEIAQRSGGQLAYERDSNEVSLRKPLLPISIPVPGVFRSPPDTYEQDGRFAPTQLPFGAIDFVSIGAVDRQVRIALRLLSVRVDGGCLTVEPRRVQGGALPAPTETPDWAWTYRSCDDEPSLALALRVSNRASEGEAFPSNQQFDMKVCRPAFSKPGVYNLEQHRDTFWRVDWIREDGRAVINPSRITAGIPHLLVISIPLSAFANLVDQVRNPLGRARGFYEDPGTFILRTSAGRRVIRLPPLNRQSLAAGQEMEMSRRLACNAGRQRVNWSGVFGARNLLLGRKIGPDPDILVNRLLDAPIRAQLPRLTLPVRNSGQLLSLERRSVEALFGQGAPNPYAFAGLGPSELDSIPPPAAAPRGLARIPRRP